MHSNSYLCAYENEKAFCPAPGGGYDARAAHGAYRPRAGIFRRHRHARRPVRSTADRPDKYAGIVSEAEHGTVERCNNYADLYDVNSSGGICAAVSGGSKITDCANYGDIYGQCSGGIVFKRRRQGTPSCLIRTGANKMFALFSFL